MMKNSRNLRSKGLAFAVALLLTATGHAVAQAEATYDSAAESAREDFESSLRKLSELRERIAAEKLPLTRKLGNLENRLVEMRAEYESASRALDTSNLELNNLGSEVEGLRQEHAYLSNLLNEYVRNLETRIHITELQRYRDLLERARNAPDNKNLSATEAYEAQLDVVRASVERLQDLVGGTTFSGTAVDGDGAVRDVTFALVGPIAVYRSADGGSAGYAEQRLGSLEPNMIAFDSPENAADTAALVATGAGTLPLDPTMGDARKIEATEESLAEHVSAGGPVMVPILLLAISALVVSIIKWIQLARIGSPSTKAVASFMNAVARRDLDGANTTLQRISGPTGQMLRTGIDNIDHPKALVEELMYEKMLETKLRLQSYLPFVALAASAAPLLGLLGTVTGMINTFRLITVFGTGDAKTLSSGISEALVTTEFGLIVAIPSLLLYAFLSRKARRMIDGMEKTAVSLLNRIVPGGDRKGDPDSEERPRTTAAPSQRGAVAET